MSRIRLQTLSALTLGLFLSTSTPLLAAELSVADCDGMVRASIDGNPGLQGSVNVVLSDALDNSEIALWKLADSNKPSNTKLTSYVKEGKAVFPSVAAGRWQLCDTKATYQVANVSITPKSSSDDVAGIIGGVAGIAGLALASVSLSDDGGDSGSSASGSVVSESLLGGSNSSGGGSSSPSINKPSSSSALRPFLTQEECLTNEEPTPLSPFL